MTQIYQGNRYEELDNVLRAYRTGSRYEPKKYPAGQLFVKNYVHFPELLYEESYDPLMIGLAQYFGISTRDKFTGMFRYDIYTEREISDWADTVMGSSRRSHKVPRIFFAYYVSDQYLRNYIMYSRCPAPGNKNNLYDHIINFIWSASSDDNKTFVEILWDLLKSDSSVMFNAQQDYIVENIRKFVRGDPTAKDLLGIRMIFSVSCCTVSEILRYVLGYSEHMIYGVFHKDSYNLSGYLTGRIKKTHEKICNKYYMNSDSAFSDMIVNTLN